MKRRFLAIIVTVALVFVGWSAGVAQSRVANFEISVDAPRGEVTLTCHRGCEWTGPGFPGGLQRITFRCDTERCRGTVTEHGRVMLGQPLQTSPTR